MLPKPKISTFFSATGEEWRGKIKATNMKTYFVLSPTDASPAQRDCGTVALEILAGH